MGSIEESASHDAVTALTAQVRRDLARIAHPRMPWLEPRLGPDGKPALDVLIVGAGQSGLAIAFALMRAQVDNILVIDKAEYGREGPWLTYARMRTLRSPKDYTGPDLDVPSLTYQAWHEARFGAESWNALELIPRELWAEYLLWMRETTAIPVRNGLEAIDIAPAADDLIAVTVQRERRQPRDLACPQAGARDRHGGHGRLVDARFRVGLAEPFARACGGCDRLRRPARQGGRRAGRRRFGARQRRRGARARCIRGPPLLPADDPAAGAALSLAHVRGLPAASVGPGRCLALALHEHHPRAARGLSPGDLGPLRAACELPSAHRRALARRARRRRPRRAADAARAVSRRLSDLRDGRGHGLRASARAAIGSRRTSRPGQTATRRRRSSATTAWPVPLPRQRLRIDREARRRDALDAATFTSSPSPPP